MSIHKVNLGTTLNKSWQYLFQKEYRAWWEVFENTNILQNLRTEITQNYYKNFEKIPHYNFI